MRIAPGTPLFDVREFSVSRIVQLLFQRSNWFSSQVSTSDLCRRFDKLFYKNKAFFTTHRNQHFKAVLRHMIERKVALSKKKIQFNDACIGFKMYMESYPESSFKHLFLRCIDSLLILDAVPEVSASSSKRVHDREVLFSRLEGVPDAHVGSAEASVFASWPVLNVPERVIFPLKPKEPFILDSFVFEKPILDAYFRRNTDLECVFSALKSKSSCSEDVYQNGLLMLRSFCECSPSDAAFSIFVDALHLHVNARLSRLEAPEKRFEYECFRLTLLKVVVVLANELGKLALLPDLIPFSGVKGFKSRERDPETGKPVLVLEGKTLLLDNKSKYGRGSYGRVKSAHFDGKKVAVKRMRLAFDNRLDQYKHLIAFLFEAHMMSYLHHCEKDVFLKVMGVYLYEDGKSAKLPSGHRKEGTVPKVAIVMEEGAMSGADFLMFHAFDLPPYIRVLRAAAYALKVLHDHHVCHNDFKFQNTLIVKRSDQNKFCLCDMGLSFFTHPKMMFPQKRLLLGGTYPCPEGFMNKTVDYRAIDYSKIDVFAFGMEIYRVLTYLSGRSLLFYDPNLAKRPAEVSASGSLSHPLLPVLNRIWTMLDGLSKSKDVRIQKLAALSKKCLDLDPRSRPSMDEAFKTLHALLS